MTFRPVDASWVIETDGPSDTPTKYLLVGWIDQGVLYPPIPVVAVPGKGIAELRTIIGEDPWTLRCAVEEDW